jgi:hypothetical protein
MAPKVITALAEFDEGFRIVTAVVDPAETIVHRPVGRAALRFALAGVGPVCHVNRQSRRVGAEGDQRVQQHR